MFNYISMGITSEDISDIRFDDDYPLIFKTKDDIIRDINFKNPEDEAITRAIVDSLERNIAKNLAIGKAVAIPYMGVMRKNPIHKAMQKHTKELKFARRNMIKEDYAEYCYRIYKLEKETIRKKESLKQAITSIRKYNSKKYFNLLTTYGKGYADAYIFSIFACKVIDFDPEVQEKFDELYKNKINESINS